MTKKKEVLIFQKGVRFFTTSLDISDNFTKTHKEIMRAIKNAHCSDVFRRRNFVPREYTKRGKSTDYYDVSEAGFSWVILGLTGKEYAPWKEKYINTFQYMRNLISDPTRIPHREENLKSNVDFNAAVEEYKIYVTGESSAPEMSQMIFNDMVNRALFDFPKGMKKIPDKLVALEPKDKESFKKLQRDYP